MQKLDLQPFVKKMYFREAKFFEKIENNICLASYHFVTEIFRPMYV